MNKFSRFPFLRFLLVFILGIVLYDYFPIATIKFLVYGCLGVGMAYSYLFIRKDTINNPLLIGMVGCVFLITTGYLLAYLHTPKTYPQHYTHSQTIVDYYEVTVDNLVEEKEKTWKTTGEVRSIINHNGILSTSGKILLYFDNNSIEKPCYGDVFMVKATPQIIMPPKNPQEFDYQLYLSRQGVYCQQYLTAISCQKIAHNPSNVLIDLALKTNMMADSILTTFVGNKQEYGVATAMILGQRDDLDSDLMQAYSAAGAIHVLSVSGLHVGVIYAVLLLALGKLKRKGATGKYLFVGIILLLLWFYALITGLSSPVLRSTFMFSIIVIAQTFRKQQNAYNTVAFSAFCLLLINPNFVFNVGFQLSYLAVLGMIYFQPQLNSLFFIDRSRSWFHRSLDRLWKVTTVAVAAQLATFPITIYYFHQFPNYFLLINPIVILLSSIVLIMGLSFVILAYGLLIFNLLPIVYCIGQCLKYTIIALNNAVLWTESLPYSITKFLWLSSSEMWLLYLLLFALIALWETKNFKWVVMSGLLTVLLISVKTIEKYHQHTQELLVILSNKKHAVYTIVQGKKALLLSDSTFLGSRKNIGYSLNNYWSSVGVLDTMKVNMYDIRTIEKLGISLKSNDSITVFSWQDKTFLQIAKNFKNIEFQGNKVSVDYLILSHKSVKDMNQVIEKVQFKTLIIDGTYTAFYANKLVNQAKALGIKYYDLTKQGALIID
jgi:competence protein ComEC